MNSLFTRIYTFVFLNDFILIYPLYAVMFTDHGLSAAEVASILAVWSGVVFLLEIPSGVLADKFSRRKILFWAQLSRALGYGVWIFFPNYWGFLTGFLLWGIKSALSHGTFEALVFDELKAEGEEGQYAKVMSRVRALAFLAILLASAGASAAILVGYEFVLVLSILSILGAAFVAWNLPSAPRSKEADEPEAKYFVLLRLGITNVLRDPVVLRIAIFMAFIGGILGTLDEFWPIFADMSGAAKWGIPLFVGVISGVQGLASFHAHRFESLGDRVFYAGVVVAGVLLMVAAAIMSLWVLGLLILVSTMDAVVRVVFDARLQHRIGSETRATISSVGGLLTELFGLVGLGTFGLVSAWKGAQSSFVFMGLMITIGGLGYLFFFRQGGYAPKETDGRHRHDE
jgi:MFS family permease